MAKKVVEDKIQIRQFKSGSSDFWVAGKHYNFNSSGDIIFVCGGISTKEEVIALENFIKRNKKQFVASTPLIFAQEEKEYIIIDFGKYKGKNCLEIVETDKSYAKWLHQNTTDDKVKVELKELLKIK